MEIIESLTDHDYTAYLVGGCVRDFLAGVPPKDFDITTNALPNQIKKSVRRAYVIGRRFRLVLVHRDNIQYEVATFRREPTKEELADEDIQNDNLFGEPEQDALRRDFTINALFYDPETKTVIDYADGLKDIDDRCLRIIGDPKTRIIEDPIRILRALRLSHKLSFQIEPSLRKAIAENHSCLQSSPLPRIREDLLKILKLKEPSRCLLEAYDLGIVETCFPLLQKIFDDPEMCEAFTTSLNRAEQLLEEASEPKEVLLGFAYSIIKAINVHKDLELWDTELHEEVYEAFKDEFGMFKAEIEFLRKAIRTLPSMTRLESFLNRGRKRQFNFLADEVFPYTLKLANWDFYITRKQYQIWLDLYRRELPKMVQKDVEKIKARYRKRN